jgi:hypothetical protein
MSKCAAIGLLVGVLASVGWAAGTDKAALAKKQDRLSVEYGLAKEAKFYFVLDVPGRKIELRARGMVLKSWEVERMRFWGRPDFAGSAVLVQKTALKAPEKIVIKPGDAEEAAKPEPSAKPVEPATATTSADYDLEAIELRDMPTRFALDLDNGVHIAVRAGAGDKPSLWIRLMDAWRWYVGLPLRDLIGKKKGPAPAELELILASDQDAQAIYWHLYDGIKGIIF